MLSDFANSLAQLRDERLGYVTSQLRDEPFDRKALPLIVEARERLDEMLAELPRSETALSASSRIPDARRREIEDYFRGLSDDFGSEDWNTETFPQ